MCSDAGAASAGVGSVVGYCVGLGGLKDVGFISLLASAAPEVPAPPAFSALARMAAPSPLFSRSMR